MTEKASSAEDTHDSIFRLINRYPRVSGLHRARSGVCDCPAYRRPSWWSGRPAILRNCVGGRRRLPGYWEHAALSAEPRR